MGLLFGLPVVINIIIKLYGVIGMKDFMKNLRAGVRAVMAVAAIPFVVGMAAAQGFIVGPLTGNYTVIPNMLYKCMRSLFGYKVEFNKASAPVVKDKQAWFVVNHLSISDFIVVGSTINGTFAGKGDILKWPAVAHLARAAKYIGLRRSSEYNEQSRAKIIKNFNEGYNTIMFPEGTTTDGKQVRLFRAALLTILFGEKGVDKEKKEVLLEKEVVVQPVSIRVKSVNGKDATGNDELRNLYSMPDENSTLRGFWRQMQLRNVVIELTTLPPLHPKDFKDAKDMINKAALDIAAIVNPGQTTFEKAQIPVAAPKKKAA